MYFSNEVLKKTNNGKKIIKNLFKIINKSPKKYIETENISKKFKERSVSDFVAGMTDRLQSIYIIKKNEYF